MMMQDIKTIFIDLDDTLWNFTENSKIALRHVYDTNSISQWCDYERFNGLYKEKNNELWELYHYGKIDKEFLVTERFRYVFELIGCNIENSETLATKLNEEYLNYLAEQPTLVPGALELLQHLTKHFKVHILSNGFKGIQAKKLHSGGIDKYIDKIVLSDEVGYTKPLKEIFDVALKMVEADATTTVMIGDNYDADICGAHNAGWKTIFFNRKNAIIDDTVADITVNKLADIISLF
ncbi:MAG: YjjG family noncanonical pyrimidine nucleotidase [Muribaculaceae bacterium]